MAESVSIAFALQPLLNRILFIKAIVGCTAALLLLALWCGEVGQPKAGEQGCCQVSGREVQGSYTYSECVGFKIFISIPL